MAITKASLRSLWWKGIKASATTFALLDTDKTGMGDIALNEIPTVTPVFGRTADGTFALQIETTAPPSDFNTFDMMFLEDTEVEHRLLQMAREKRPLYLQRLTYNCPPVNNRALWKTLEHFKLVPDSGTLAAGPNRDGSDGVIEDTVSIKVLESVRLYRTTLSGLTTTEVQPIECIAGLGDANDCMPGYPGSFEILVFGAASTGAAVANALYSLNGGATIAAYTTDPTPFVDVDRDIAKAQTGIISDTQFRVVYYGGAAAAAKVIIAYQDFSVAATTLTAASWNLITIAATSNADATEAAFWDQSIGRMYIGAAGDIYVSTDDIVTDPGAAKFTGANAIAQFAKDEDNNIWMVAAANSIRRELANDRDTFGARTGPSGGGAFTAIGFADDGTMYAGNGTAVYKNTDKAATADAWTSLKDFGASHSVIRIEFRGGVSQCPRVYVDDTSPAAGEVWESEDAGENWRQVTETANDGYNDVLLTNDPNRAFVAGDDVSSLGVIELLSNP